MRADIQRLLDLVEVTETTATDLVKKAIVAGAMESGTTRQEVLASRLLGKVTAVKFIVTGFFAALDSALAIESEQIRNATVGAMANQLNLQTDILGGIIIRLEALDNSMKEAVEQAP